MFKYICLLLLKSNIKLVSEYFRIENFGNFRIKIIIIEIVSVYYAKRFIFRLANKLRLYKYSHFFITSASLENHFKNSKKVQVGFLDIRYV